ncbi:MAG: ABC transporter ATP-binding protein [Nitrospiraceae bacterium]|nr:ABC transporter ATP-binding protein [Nitrospiraceae bacterium]
MAAVIKVEGLSKQYRIGKAIAPYKTFREALVKAAKAPVHLFTGRSKTADDTIWALKDVSFEVNVGEVVGIIGRNGAGKSTLLKILSRITEPTEGEARLKGRVGSLLEVGTGFHPELTGRENIFLNGVILGMRKEEVRKKFDEIVSFAEIEKFLDTPVKRYSSGMYVRLAFAVAAHLEPEILVVDEVLAVGDAQFQKKCLGKMGEVAKGGRTVLFVSHNMESLLNLCSKAILLKNGQLAEYGETREIVHQYLSQSSIYTSCQEWKDPATAPGNDKAKFIKALVRPLTVVSGTLQSDMPFEFEFQFINLLSGENNLDVTYHLIDERGILVYVASTGFSKNDKFGPGLLKAKCRVPGNLLNDGSYTVSRLLLVKDRGHVIYEHRNVLTFDIISPGTGQLGWAGQKEGVIRPKLEWDLSFDSKLEP